MGKEGGFPGEVGGGVNTMKIHYMEFSKNTHTHRQIDRQTEISVGKVEFGDTSNSNTQDAQAGDSLLVQG